MTKTIKYILSLLALSCMTAATFAQSQTANADTTRNTQLRQAIITFDEQNLKIVGDAIAKIAIAADSIAKISTNAFEKLKPVLTQYAQDMTKQALQASQESKTQAKDAARTQVDNLFLILEEATKFAKAKADSVINSIDE